MFSSFLFDKNPSCISNIHCFPFPWSFINFHSHPNYEVRSFICYSKITGKWSWLSCISYPLSFAKKLSLKMIVRVIFKYVLFYLDSRYHLCMLLDESNQRRIRGCLIISREHLPGFTFYHQQKVLLDCPKTSAIVIEYRALVLRPFAELSSIWGQWGFQVSRYLCNIVLNFSRKISP